MFLGICKFYPLKFYIFIPFDKDFVSDLNFCSRYEYLQEKQSRNPEWDNRGDAGYTRIHCFTSHSHF